MARTTVKASDSTIQKMVADELEWIPQLDASRVGIAVHDGAVTLSGEVSSNADLIAARNAAFRVKGVLAVADELTIEHPGVADPSDSEIAQALNRALSWTIGVTGEDVRADVRDQIVTLTGTVDWEYQRSAAQHAVQHVTGVHFVDNQIVLSPRPSAIAAEEQIREALIRNAIVDANSIKVVVEGSKVVLSGAVRSWHEKKAAERAVWGSGHVTEVHNNLTVEPD